MTREKRKRDAAVYTVPTTFAPVPTTFRPANVSIGKFLALEQLMAFNEDALPTDWPAARTLIESAGSVTPCASYGQQAAPPSWPALYRVMSRGTQLDHVYDLYARMLRDKTLAPPAAAHSWSCLIGAARCGHVALMQELWPVARQHHAGDKLQSTHIGTNAWWKLAVAAVYGGRAGDQDTAEPLSLVCSWFEELRDETQAWLLYTCMQRTVHDRRDNKHACIPSLRGSGVDTWSTADNSLLVRATAAGSCAAVAWLLDRNARLHPGHWGGPFHLHNAADAVISDVRFDLAAKQAGQLSCSMVASAYVWALCTNNRAIMSAIAGRISSPKFWSGVRRDIWSVHECSSGAAGYTYHVQLLRQHEAVEQKYKHGSGEEAVNLCLRQERIPRLPPLAFLRTAAFGQRLQRARDALLTMVQAVNDAAFTIEVLKFPWPQYLAAAALDPVLRTLERADLVRALRQILLSPHVKPAMLWATFPAAFTDAFASLEHVSVTWLAAYWPALVADPGIVQVMIAQHDLPATHANVTLVRALRVLQQQQ